MELKKNHGPLNINIKYKIQINIENKYKRSNFLEKFSKKE